MHLFTLSKWRKYPVFNKVFCNILKSTSFPCGSGHLVGQIWQDLGYSLWKKILFFLVNRLGHDDNIGIEIIFVTLPSGMCAEACSTLDPPIFETVTKISSIHSLGHDKFKWTNSLRKVEWSFGKVQSVNCVAIGGSIKQHRLSWKIKSFSKDS